MPSCCWWGLFRSPGSANGRLGLACDGLGRIRALPPLPPSSQPRPLVSSLEEREPHLVVGTAPPREAFVGEGPLIVGIDETLESDALRQEEPRGQGRLPRSCPFSTHETFVKSSVL